MRYSPLTVPVVVMVAVPGPTPVARPCSSTVTTAVSLLTKRCADLAGHVLHRTIIPGRLRLELLLDADGNPGLLGTYLQRGEGGGPPPLSPHRHHRHTPTAPGLPILLSKTCPMPFHFSLNHSLVRLAQSEPGPPVATAV